MALFGRQWCSRMIDNVQDTRGEGIDTGTGLDSSSAGRGCCWAV